MPKGEALFYTALWDKEEAIHGSSPLTPLSFKKINPCTSTQSQNGGTAWPRTSGFHPFFDISGGGLVISAKNAARVSNTRSTEA